MFRTQNDVKEEIKKIFLEGALVDLKHAKSNVAKKVPAAEELFYNGEELEFAAHRLVIGERH